MKTKMLGIFLLGFSLLGALLALIGDLAHIPFLTTWGGYDHMPRPAAISIILAVAGIWIIVNSNNKNQNK